MPAATRKDGVLARLRGDDSARSLGLYLLAGSVAAAVIVPLLWLVATALGVGVEAAGLLVQPASVRVFFNSVVLVAAVTAASIAIAAPLAYLTVRTNLPGRRFWTIAVSMPLVVPSYIGAFAFASAFGPRGALQSALAPLGVESLPRIYGFHGAVLVLTLYTYPYVYLTTRAALISMDTTLVEAARTLDHDRLSAERRVTLPQIKPAVAAGSLLVALYALSDFGTPAIMGYDAYTRFIFVRFNSFSRDLATLLSLQLVGLTVVILAIESRIRGEGVQSSASGQSDPIDLGRWRWVGAGLCAAVSGLALAVPIGILLLWLLGGTDPTGSGHAFELAYVLNSVTVSGIAAAVAALAALPVAYLAAFRRSRLATLFERVSYVGYAVPGVVMGLALVFFGARYLGPLYQTLPMLVFAYVVRFLPQAVGSSEAGFLQIDPRLPEAARTLGRSSIGAFRSVTLPLAAPGIVAGAALVFLTSMKELPATLMLRPTGFVTLVTQVWRAHKAGYFGQAAVPALILVAVSGLSMLVIISREGSDFGVSSRGEDEHGR